MPLPTTGRHRHHNRRQYLSLRSNGTTRFLKAGAGVAATAIGLTAVSGTAAAHFHGPDKTALNIDIKPGNSDNTINPKSHGVIPVAVLQTDEFNPTNENVNYCFGAPDVVKDGSGARPAYGGHVKDVDGDGNDDLLVHFPTREYRIRWR